MSHKAHLRVVQLHVHPVSALAHAAQAVVQHRGAAPGLSTGSQQGHQAMLRQMCHSFRAYIRVPRRLPALPAQGAAEDGVGAPADLAVSYYWRSPADMFEIGLMAEGILGLVSMVGQGCNDQVAGLWENGCGWCKAQVSRAHQAMMWHTEAGACVMSARRCAVLLHGSLCE